MMKFSAWKFPLQRHTHFFTTLSGKKESIPYDNGTRNFQFFQSYNSLDFHQQSIQPELPSPFRPLVFGLPGRVDLQTGISYDIC